MPGGASAASSPWSQIDWSGGSGQSSFTDTTKFSSFSGVVTSTSNQITLSSQNVGNTGTGTDGAITVSADKNINTDTIISGRSCSDGGDAVNYTVTSGISSGASSITLSSTPASGCLATGDEIVIINIEGTSSDNSHVGEYETATISGISSATLTLGSALSHAYDGTTQKIMVQRVPNYTNVTISSGKTLTASAWNGTKGGVLFFRATGTVTVTGTISANALGYRGGTNNANGESYDGSVGIGGAIGVAGTAGGGSGSGDTSSSPAGTRGGGGASGAVNSGGDQGAGGGAGGGYGGGGGGGGGGADCNANAGAGGSGGDTGVSAGGGGGGMWNGSCNLSGNGGNAGSPGGGGSSGNGASAGGAVGSGGTTGEGGGGGRGDGPGGVGGVGSGGGGGGGTYGTSDLSTIFFGSGGGGGNMSGNNGQAGGGIISISANTLTNNGSISANGANATSGSSESGAGGAGAGGSVLLSASTLTIGSGAVTASGGSSTNGTVKGAGGGGGGVGRVAAYSENSISGTSSPSYATTTPLYQTSGTLTSSILDTTFSDVTWGTLTYSATTPTNTSVSVKVRTGNQADLSDATSFSSCTAISSGSSIANNSCVSSSNRYVQYQISLSTSDTAATPTFTSFSLPFTQNSSNSSSSGNSSSGSCNAVSSSAPDLYEIDPSQSSVTLYFTPVLSADTYYISYGTTNTANQYAVTLHNSDHTGAVKYTITHLEKETNYYFKVRGCNGCSNGDWSSVVMQKTKTQVSTSGLSNAVETVTKAFTPEKKLEIVSSQLTTPSLTPEPTKTVEPPPSETGVKLDVKVLGTDNKPVVGVNVTLHSKVQVAKTDSLGIAHFMNVEKGEHKVLLAYNGYTGQQNLTVDGSKKDQVLTMQVKLTNGIPWGVYATTVLILLVIIGFLFFLLLKKHKQFQKIEYQ